MQYDLCTLKMLSLRATSLLLSITFAFVLADSTIN
jgi:hypothetical protein